SLLLPNWYAASVRVLPPETSGANPLASALLRGGAGSAASALLGGISSDYARYLAILSSRRVMSSTVEEFDLVAAYDLEDAPHPHEAAIKQLEDNVSFPVDENYEFLSVVVLDKDPRRAANMANFMVRQLNAINSELASQNAASYRRFVQRRYDEAQMALDSVLDATQVFQQRYGVVDLDVQSQAYFSHLASLEANATLAQVQYEAQLAQLGPNNEEVQALRAVAAAAERKVQDVLAGRESVLPVPRGAMSSVARAYVDLQRELTVQSQILEVIGPLLEQARFEEEKTVEAVQVVDAAVPPVRKAKPRRSLLVITATLTAFLLTSLFVLAYAWWQRRYAYLAHRLRTSVEKSAPRERVPVSN
ncbi:MAG TPA: GNVR domain-containing protein, partial [Rhodothermales bacterium]|nr:GNVR domain-containing protein [Rhodothermales bacterium]